MNTISKSNQLAIEICDNKKYRYLYGAKGEQYTSELVKKFAKLYPNVFTPSIYKLAMADADKGYKAIDCSGFVCKVLGVAMQGSSQLCSTAVKKLPVEKANAKPGMALWRNGHIAYVGKDLKIYEASSTANDMKVSTFDNRAAAFTYLLVVKGSALADELANPAPAPKPIKPTPKPDPVRPKDSFPLGTKVKVNGKIYANANGSGNSVEKKNATMYIVGAAPGYKYPYGVALKKNGTRQGWTNAASLKRC